MNLAPFSIIHLSHRDTKSKQSSISWVLFHSKTSIKYLSSKGEGGGQGKSIIYSSALQINIIPLPVTMNRKRRNHRSNQTFGGHDKTKNKTSLTTFSM